MAKITSVEIVKVPEEIQVNDNLSDIIVQTRIEFHPIDVHLNMEYILNLLVYDINGKIDLPIIYSNWDASEFSTISEDRKDLLIGQTKQLVTANELSKEINLELTLRLGNTSFFSSKYSRKLEVLGILIPAIDKAMKWSKPFEANLVY